MAPIDDDHHPVKHGDHLHDHTPVILDASSPDVTEAEIFAAFNNPFSD